MERVVAAEPTEPLLRDQKTRCGDAARPPGQRVQRHREATWSASDALRPEG